MGHDDDVLSTLGVEIFLVPGVVVQGPLHSVLAGVEHFLIVYNFSVELKEILVFYNKNCLCSYTVRRIYALVGALLVKVLTS